MEILKQNIYSLIKVDNNFVCHYKGVHNFSVRRRKPEKIFSLKLLKDNVTVQVTINGKDKGKYLDFDEVVELFKKTMMPMPQKK